MLCPYCSNNTRVIDKRNSPTGTRRRRECLGCRKRFTTYENIRLKELMVIKSDGRKQPFSREKLVLGLKKALEKRPGIEKVEEIADQIESKLRSGKKAEVKSSRIGELVLRKLSKTDKVAYMRFASVYRQFEDIRSFEKELKNIKNK